jgi:hypothetical protein
MPYTDAVAQMCTDLVAGKRALEFIRTRCNDGSTFEYPRGLAAKDRHIAEKATDLVLSMRSSKAELKKANDAVTRLRAEWKKLIINFFSGRRDEIASDFDRIFRSGYVLERIMDDEGPSVLQGALAEVLGDSIQRSPEAVAEALAASTYSVLDPEYNANMLKNHRESRRLDIDPESLMEFETELGDFEACYKDLLEEMTECWERTDEDE